MRKQFKAKLERIQKQKDINLNFGKSPSKSKFRSTEVKGPSTISIVQPPSLYEEVNYKPLGQKSILKNNESAWNELIKVKD